MAKVLLEDVCGEFIVDRSAVDSKGLVKENVSTEKYSTYRVPGKFSFVNVKNGNNRRYGRRVWEKNLSNGSQLQDLIRRNAAFGLLEHPEDGVVNLRSEWLSHAVTRAQLQEDEIVGELLILDFGDNSPGRRLKVLIEAGYNPCVSSRGFGSLERAADGVDEVQDDFVCEGWDVVIRPSFEKAELSPSRLPIDTKEAVAEFGLTEEQTTYINGLCGDQLAHVGSFIEKFPDRSKSLQVGTPMLKLISKLQEGLRKELVLTESTSGGKMITASQSSTKVTIMDTKQIRSLLETLRPGKEADASRFNGCMTQLAELHQDVANYVAEDAKRSYEGTRLHDEIKLVESAWTTAQEAPKRQVAQLKEEKVKLLRVAKAITERAVAYRTSLAESLKKLTSVSEANEKLLSRGRAWRDRALSLREGTNNLDLQLDVVSEAFDMLVARYNGEITKLARELVEIKYPEALKANEAARKLLESAAHPDDIDAVLDLIEPSGEKNDEKKAPVAAKADESKKAEEPSKKPAVTQEGLRLITEVRDPFNFTESIGIARRLSEASLVKA